jgi:Ni/Co efflux regulator RcnB
VIGNWGYYHLPPPPYGYQWVRGDHQYVLLGINSGVIAQVIIP